jgi:hypothetical protein
VEVSRLYQVNDDFRPIYHLKRGDKYLIAGMAIYARITSIIYSWQEPDRGVEVLISYIPYFMDGRKLHKNKEVNLVQPYSHLVKQIP